MFSRIRNLLWIARVAFQELIHEKVFFGLGVFAIVAVAASTLLGQLTYTDHAKLTLDFLLGAAQLSMALFAILMGITLFQRELSQGSIALLLSKPVSRGTALAGKWLGQVGMQYGVVLVLAVLTLSILTFQGQPLPLTPIAQTLSLVAVESTVLAAMAYFFATIAGPLIAGAACFLLFALGHSIDPLSKAMQHAEGKWMWDGLLALLPNLEVFNMKTLASYGLSISASDYSWIVLYGILCTTFFLACAIFCFHHRDIAT